MYESKAVQKGSSLRYSINYFVINVLNDVLSNTSHVENILQKQFSSH